MPEVPVKGAWRITVGGTTAVMVDRDSEGVDAILGKYLFSILRDAINRGLLAGVMEYSYIPVEEMDDLHNKKEAQ